MKLPLFRLLEPCEGLALPGALVWERPHEKAAGACQRCYAIPEGHVVLTTWQGLLHEVIYQTPADDDAAAARRNAALSAHYGEGQLFREVVDNAFGKVYRRADMNRYALWSYAMDFTTFGTMEFHAAVARARPT